MHISDAPNEIPTTTEGLIHTGREARLYPGEGAIDIAAIVKHELMPLEPDIIVYHHGTNAFSIREMMDDVGKTAVAPSDLLRYGVHAPARQVRHQDPRSGCGDGTYRDVHDAF